MVGAVGLASRAVDGIFKAPCEASVLFPRSGGNIHSFTALTPCAILDVLSPPYSEELGRPSTYFSDFHIPSLPGNYIISVFTISRKKKIQFQSTYFMYQTFSNFEAPNLSRSSRLFTRTVRAY